MGNMALLWEGYGIFSDLLILFRFPGLQVHYIGRNVHRIMVHYKKFFNRPFGPITKTVEMTIQTIDELNMEKSIVQ